MTTTKRIMAFVVLTIACLPLVMVFNDNGDTFHINLLGFAYGWLLFKYGKKIAPKFVIDYLNEAVEDDDEELD